MAETISGAEYKELRARYDRDDKTLTNAERSAIEVYEFVHNPPDAYVLYVTRTPVSGGNCPVYRVTTWAGDTLGHATMGDAYRSNFGDRRRPIAVHAINGKTYHGTFYESAGDYARIRLAKHK